jgi:hydrogenase nickel incorporation protein HypB
MCANCGCGEGKKVTLTDMRTGEHVHVDAEGHEVRHSHSHETGHEHSHSHSHDHSHTHEHEHSEPQLHLPGEHRLEHHHHHEDGHHSHSHAEATTIQLEQDILHKNDRLAEQNRGWLEGRGIRALNIMSSPGAGKTTLLERTIRDQGQSLDIRVIEGDQETTRDGERIRAAGSTVIQINTGAGCHLDADMIGRALRQLDPPARSMILIENVGNLVCPAMFDLGEKARVVVASVAEGDDKPSKYPHMFRGADLVLLNKMDLLPYVNFKTADFEKSVHDLNPHARILPVSATTGTGLEAWYQWLKDGSQTQDD